MSFPGRVFLQAGDIPNAKAYFTSSLALLDSTPPGTPNETLTSLRHQAQLNTGLLAVSENNYQAAYDTFSALDKSSVALTGEAKFTPQPVRNLDKPGSTLEKLHILAVNNLSICAFYLGRLRESIELLESLLKYRQCLASKSFVANLCTMYELYHVNVGENKMNLMKLMNENKVYFNPSCLASLKL